MVVVTNYVCGGAYSLSSTPNDSLLRNIFMAGLFNLRVFNKILLTGSRQRTTFLSLVLMPVARSLNPGFRFNKLAHTF